MSRFLSFVLVSGFLRAGIIQIATQFSSIIFIQALLGKGRKVWAYLSFVVFKSLLLSWLSLQYFPSDSLGPAIATVSANALGAAATCLLFFYTFKVEPVKGFLCIAITEVMMWITTIPSFIIINTLENNSELFLIYSKCQPLDLLFLLLIPAFTAVLYFILRKFLCLFRKFEVRHRHIGMAICILYFALVQLTSIGAPPVKAFLPLWIDALCLFVILYIYMNYRQETYAQQTAINNRLNLMQSRYNSVQKQMSYITEYRKIIDKQMHELAEKEKTASLNITEKTAEYIQDLKAIYNNLNSGVYCSDWNIDAVLYTQITLAKQRGLKTSCEVTGIPSEREDIDLLIQILLYLFKFLFSSANDDGSEHYKDSTSVYSGNIFIKISQFLNQQVILFSCPASEIDPQLSKKIKNLIKKNNGSLEIQEADGQMEIAITFEC